MLSRRVLLAGSAAASLSPAAVLTARADPERAASAWSEASHSAVRLIAGGSADEGWAAGVEFKLANGFKTYWRDPGDAGTPPVFDWTGSENCKAIRVIWPAPERFEDGSSSSIGYHDPLILPVVVTPADATAPIRLRLAMSYAICATMCIPAQGQAVLGLAGPRQTEHAGRIAEAASKAPVKTALGTAAPSGLAISAATILAGAKPALATEIVAPDPAAAIDLFVEGPRGSFFSKPALKERSSGGVARLISPIEEKPAGLSAWPLRLTLVAGGRSIEVDTTVNASALL
ncbi:MAG: hypothetical protein BGP06_16850 [Rhizobiales bacterium 65-9]|mgnify:CR=1 FL=1|nr:hypothetical protein [Hyphomicrobiales bacterium]OJY38108.1 MAG: hypothetical protein BGP06_16850 [Rhizobiales bacterium 65-9]